MSTPFPQQEAPPQPPPQIALLQMATGYWVSQSLYVAAELGLADLLQDRPQTAEELAKATATHAPTLYRLLRALQSVGVLTADGAGRFALTPLGEPLRSGPGSMRAMIRHLLEKPSWEAWGNLRHSIETGETAFLHTHGMEVFDYYTQHPASAHPFNDAMTEYSGAVIAAVNKAYDFSPFEKIIDIGGGHGSLLASLLRANPHARGVLFDLPEPAAGARARLAADEVGARCTVESGDFFVAVPEGGDLYVMKTIIHDWDDERATAILRNIHRAMNPAGKIVVIDMVLPDGNEPSLGPLGDLHMLVMTGGRERSATEFAALFAGAGFRLTRVVPTESMMSLVEAERV